MKRTLTSVILAILALAPISAQQVLSITPTPGTAISAGTASFLPEGLLFSGRSVTDNATQNTWNVVSQTISANTLVSDGSVLSYRVGLVGANNTNTHEYQAYFSASSATCGGTGASLCNSGCIVLPSVTNTVAFNGEILQVDVIRTASNTEDYTRMLVGGGNTAQTTGTCSIDLTADTKFVIGTRNTSAAAASLAQVTYTVRISPK